MNLKVEKTKCEGCFIYDAEWITLRCLIAKANLEKECPYQTCLVKPTCRHLCSPHDHIYQRAFTKIRNQKIVSE